MLDEQIFDAILDLTKKGFTMTISYVEDRDTFKIEAKIESITKSFQFTPQFYSDTVASRVYLLERIKGMEWGG